MSRCPPWPVLRSGRSQFLRPRGGAHAQLHSTIADLGRVPRIFMTGQVVARVAEGYE